jgi:hypothetical protein
LGDEIGKRFEAMAPPPIQALLKKQQKQEHGDQAQPSPEEQQQAQQQAQQQQIQQAAVQLELQNKHLANEKAEGRDRQDCQRGAAAGAADPVAMVKAQAEQQRMVLDARKAEMEFQPPCNEKAARSDCRRLSLKPLVDLAIKKAGPQIDTASAVMDMQRDQMGMEQAQRHAQDAEGAHAHRRARAGL